MCGITGFWGGQAGSEDIQTVGKMVETIGHRGPDSVGVWDDVRSGVAFAHKRLAIMDLSEAGHQPMVSHCGRYVLTYNGEIYNHKDLRRELSDLGAGGRWRGHSDTETLITVLAYWGIEEGLKRLNGMFAFALWDRTDRLLYLARDRMGEKPLFYGQNNSVFLFGSELKALTAYPAWQGEVDRDALALYLRYNYIPTPWSIYKGIKKIPPAHFVVVKNSGCEVSQPVCYWDIKTVAETGSKHAFSENDSDHLTDTLDDLLRDCVGLRMESDVPLGAFLSGGYDSTMVVAQMQAQSTKPIQTFSIGFYEENYNEANHAKIVADYLHTNHTELYVTPEETMEVIPQLATIWDEPFADSSQIPTYLVSKLARRDVTVSLSGDGGDELFCGYTRYFIGGKVGPTLTNIPESIRLLMSNVIKKFPAQALNSFGGYLPGTLKQQLLGDKMQKFADVMGASDENDFYHGLISHWKDPTMLVRGSIEPATLFTQKGEWPLLPGLIERMMYLDSRTYLPDDILTKVDRATMAVSLEARVPLLDHRLVEFSWKIPTALKIRDGQGKWLLRQVLNRYVPEEIMNRPKMGFGVPIERWLRGPLREWADELLDEKRLKEEGYFNPEMIRKAWREHLSGERRWHYYLWNILMFQAWLERHAATLH